MNKPKNYWTKERCQEEALKYNRRIDFQKHSYGAYKMSFKYNIDEICSHMKIINHKPGYWTKEKCQEEALKYDNKSDFKKNSNGAYKISFKYNIDEICSHMKIIHHKPGYWTKEKCNEISLKYNNKKDFREKDPGVYSQALEQGFYDEICSHMIQIIKPKYYWTKERCQEEALKYDNRVDFQKYSSTAYNNCYKNKWLNEFCSHMIIHKNEKLRCIYAYEFDDNHVYVGLTFNIKNRNNRHMKEGSVFNHILKTNSKYKIIQLTEYIDQEIAQEKEDYYIKKYVNDNWIILNKVKSGSIGSNIVYWTKERCQEEALKYKTRTEYQVKNRGSYLSAYRNNWLDDICTHMIEGKRKNGFWNYETCKEHAKLCKSKSQFSIKYAGGYEVSLLNNWLDEFYKK
jgi:predicted GIY-YIG superfamily endonuclease